MAEDADLEKVEKEEPKEEVIPVITAVGGLVLPRRVVQNG